MPRSYTLGRRADLKDRTRTRLIEAAVELCTERGISNVTLHQVARRADVAPGTATNHFPTRDVLDAAVAELALREMVLPDPTVIDPDALLEERIERLAAEVGAFIGRAGRWYRMWQREPMLTGPWIEAGSAASAAWEAVFRAALGDLADDPAVWDVVGAVMQPPFFESVAAGRRSPEETATLVAGLVTSWLRSREVAGRQRRSSGNVSRRPHAEVSRATSSNREA